jgi:glucose uptake protein
MSYGLGQGATMVSAFWGIFVWKEFAGSEGRVKLLLAIMFVLFIGGLTLISMAPLYGTK